MCYMILNISEWLMFTCVCVLCYQYRNVWHETDFSISWTNVSSQQCVARTMLPITLNDASIILSRKHNYFIFTFIFQARKHNCIRRVRKCVQTNRMQLNRRMGNDYRSQNFKQFIMNWWFFIQKHAFRFPKHRNIIGICMIHVSFHFYYLLVLIYF